MSWDIFTVIGFTLVCIFAVIGFMTVMSVFTLGVIGFFFPEKVKANRFSSRILQNINEQN